MSNKSLIIGIVIFLIVSAGFCCVKSPIITRVNFSNQNVTLDNDSNQSLQAVSFSNVNSVQNKSLTKNNRAVNANNLSVNTQNKNIIYKNNNSVRTNGVVENNGWDAHNSNNNINNGVFSTSKPVEVAQKQRDIDWATWRSNVVNLVLETSYSVRELNKYETMTWFYYKFKVHSDGTITDINVFSLNMYEEDIQLVKRMIKSLEYNPTLNFPRNSHRNVVEVSALYVIDENEQRTNPNNFRDVERYNY